MLLNFSPLYQLDFVVPGSNMAHMAEDFSRFFWMHIVKKSNSSNKKSFKNGFVKEYFDTSGNDMCQPLLAHGNTYILSEQYPDVKEEDCNSVDKFVLYVSAVNTQFEKEYDMNQTGFNFAFQNEVKQQFISMVMNPPFQVKALEVLRILHNAIQVNTDEERPDLVMCEKLGDESLNRLIHSVGQEEFPGQGVPQDDVGPEVDVAFEEDDPEAAAAPHVAGGDLGGFVRAPGRGSRAAPY